MKHKLIAAAFAAIVMAANISAMPMPENPSVAARQLPSEWERNIVAEYAAPEGEHWSATEKEVNSIPYQPPERGVKDAGRCDYPSVTCGDSSPDKGSQGEEGDADTSTAGGASPSPTKEETPEGVEFVATAYCPCAKCCGKYAYNRPIDENGEPIVYTSTGARAVQGRTIAVDPSVIPYGTHVLINGVEYVAEDCGGNIKGRRIDVYFADHAEADAFGRQTVTVEVIG